MTPIEKNINVIDEYNNQHNSTYLRRAKGLVKNRRAHWVDENTICLLCPLLNRMEDFNMTNTVQENYNITFGGSRISGNYGPHNIPYSGQISQLKTLLGLKQDITRVNDNDIVDNDYFLQLGVSCEAYGLLYNMYDIINSQRWGVQPLIDSFSIWGIDSSIFINKNISNSIEFSDSIEMKNSIIEHLLKNLPVMILQGTICNPIIIGYEDYGNKLVRNYNIARKPTMQIEKNFIIILINGITEPCNKKDIFLRSLKRGYEMLTETSKITGKYGYGRQLYEKWIVRLDNDDMYRDKKDETKYITPEKFDLAERRFYGAHFFEQVQDYLGVDLSSAISCFKIIHSRMWEIHEMVKNENQGKLLERETRNDIIKILEHCQTLDYKAAENIKVVLNKHHTI